jgi:hypothetical protein
MKRSVAGPSQLANQLAVTQRALLALDVLIAQATEMIQITRAVTDEARVVLDALNRAECKKDSGKRRSKPLA